jgi:hypothetical protein
VNGAEGTQHSALLIGVGQYSNPDLATLAGPGVDLRSMKAALENPQIGGYQVSTLEDVDSQTACLRIEEFLGNRSEDETVVLYYSGHGFIDRKGALYLCTTNSSFATPRSSSIRADFVTDLIDNCASKRVLLLLDCCYSGNFEGAAKATSVVEPQFKGTGLGRVVLTAGAGDQLAWDLGAQGSLFSRHIAQGLTTGAADIDQDGRITVQELYDYVYREVTREQPRQRPGKWTYKEDGPSFLVARSPIQPKRELPPDLVHALESDFPKSRAAALKELEIYARRNAWAVDAITEKLRIALNDDSDSVKNVAREILGRLTGGAWATPMKPVAPAAGPSSHRSDPAPLSAKPESRKIEVETTVGIARRYPLARDIALWFAWVVITAIPLYSIANAIVLGFLDSYDPDVVYPFLVFMYALLLTIPFAMVAALYYGIVASFRDLLKSTHLRILLGTILVTAIALVWSLRGGPDETVALVLGLIDVVSLSICWKLLLDLRWRWTIPIGLLSTIYLVFSLLFLIDGFEHNSGMTRRTAAFFAICISLTPFVILLGALARRRALQSHGK